MQKKILAIVLSLAMVMAFGINVFAGDPPEPGNTQAVFSQNFYYDDDGGNPGGDNPTGYDYKFTTPTQIAVNGAAGTVTIEGVNKQAVSLSTSSTVSVEDEYNNSATANVVFAGLTLPVNVMEYHYVNGDISAAFGTTTNKAPQASGSYVGIITYTPSLG